MSDIMELVASLRAPKNPSHCGSFVEVVDAGFLETIASTIERLVAEVERLTAIAEDKLADTRLVGAGPRGDGFGFDLMGGPIPYIAEYLFQFIGGRDEDKPTSNYAEIEVNHHEFGGMTLTLQRHSGQTPHQLRQAAESRCERLEEALKPFADQADELNEASPDNRDIWENPVAMSITFGDLRRAREALEPKP